MDRTRSPIDRLALGDQRFCYLVVYLSRIGESRHYLFITIELSHRRLIANDDEKLFPALLTLLRCHKRLDPRRRLFKLAIIAMLVFCVRQLIRRTHGITDDLVRRRHRCR